MFFLISVYYGIQILFFSSGMYNLQLCLCNISKNLIDSDHSDWIEAGARREAHVETEPLGDLHAGASCT